MQEESEQSDKIAESGQALLTPAVDNPQVLDSAKISELQHFEVGRAKNGLIYYSFLKNYASSEGNLYSRIVRQEKEYKILSQIGEEIILLFIHKPRLNMQVLVATLDATKVAELRIKNMMYDLAYKEVTDAQICKKFIALTAEWIKLKQETAPQEPLKKSKTRSGNTKATTAANSPKSTVLHHRPQRGKQYQHINVESDDEVEQMEEEVEEEFEEIPTKKKKLSTSKPKPVPKQEKNQEEPRGIEFQVILDKLSMIESRISKGEARMKNVQEEQNQKISQIMQKLNETASTSVPPAAPPNYMQASPNYIQAPSQAPCYSYASQPHPFYYSNTTQPATPNKFVFEHVFHVPK